MAESREGCCAGEHVMCDYHIGWADAMDQPASHPMSDLSYEDRAYLLDLLKERLGDPAANRIRAVVWSTRYLSPNPRSETQEPVYDTENVEARTPTNPATKGTIFAPVPNPIMVTIDWGEGPRNIDDNKEASDV